MHIFYRPTGIFLRDFSSWLFIKRSRSFLSRRIIVIIATLILGIYGTKLLQSIITYALTQAFVQTDWSGGADTVNTATDANLTGWTKYYSSTAGVDFATAGQLKLKLETSQP